MLAIKLHADTDECRLATYLETAYAHHIPNIYLAAHTLSLLKHTSYNNTASRYSLSLSLPPSLCYD